VKNSALHPFEIPSSQIQIGRVGPKLQDFAIHRLADLEVFLAEKSPMHSISSRNASPFPPCAFAMSSAVVIFVSVTSRIFPLMSVTPTSPETGRSASAQFPDVSVSISSTALTTVGRSQWRGEKTKMILKNKVAVIYGAGGAIGGAVARAFAAEGTMVFLTGHTRAAVDAVAKDIGKAAEAAEVDALDEQAIDKHLQSVIDSVGRVDISSTGSAT
jgi:hypothetical protein